MIFLENDYLKISILDPLSDQNRFGSRYCTGGYIWQITDKSLGDLLSGPQFPDPNPTKFDGQGVPEVFETAIGQDLAGKNEEVLVIGVGSVLRTSSVQPFHVRDNPVVTKFCDWVVLKDNECCSMNTDQNFKKSSLSLCRKINLCNRTVISSSVLSNTGVEPIPLRWFAHPFFPHTGNLVCCQFSEDLIVPENPGFVLDQNGYLTMRREYPWVKGLFRALEMEWGEQLLVKQRHPLLSEIEIKMSFPVSRLPVWANANTFSFEPYLNATVLPGEDMRWAIEYRF